ncbi:MAG: response regulator transcription factor [Chitinophagaceae bacterium]|nr:MAG: response regulator transcription factor [Chitinophagaceae bacterium]
MTPLKIAIVEDDLIIAQSIVELLEESGYCVLEPATRYAEAISLIEKEAPDLVLLDINLPGRLDGVDIARTVRESFRIPFIFLTANTDFETISRAREQRPAAFLAKPVTRAQLYATIETAIHASQQNTPGTSQPSEAKQRKSVFVKEGNAFRRVDFKELLYAESVENYVRLHLEGGEKVLLRMTLGDFIDGLDPLAFQRVHRGFVVALERVTEVLTAAVRIGPNLVPLSKTYRDEVLARLGIQ